MPVYDDENNIHDRLITIAEDKMIALWSLSLGKCVNTYSIEKNDATSFSSLVCNDCGKVKSFLVMGKNSGNLSFLNMHNGKITNKMIDTLCGIRFLEKIDKKKFFIGLSDGSLGILQGSGGRFIFEFLQTKLPGIKIFRYMGNDIVVVVFQDESVEVFNTKVKSRSSANNSFLKEPVIGIECLSDQKALVCSKSGLYTLDLVKIKEAIKPLKMLPKQASAFLKYKDNMFVVGCIDGTCYSYDSQKNIITSLGKIHKNDIFSLLKTDNDIVIIASRDGAIAKFDMSNNTVIKTFQCADGYSPVEGEKDEEIFDLEL